MSPDFNTAFVNAIGIEKGYSNNPRDNGGETMYGVTEYIARKWGYLGPMKDMPLSTAKAIYKSVFWDTMRADELPFPIAEYLFDYAVNSGVSTAIKALQRAVGALPDGVIGPKTLGLVRSRRPRDVVRVMFVARALLFAKHPDLDAFGNGWFARLFDVTERFCKEV